MSRLRVSFSVVAALAASAAPAAAAELPDLEQSAPYGLRVERRGDGWYEPNVEGQELRIDRETTPSGRYVLSSRIGPTGLIHETRRDNNVASTVFELRWPLTAGQALVPLTSCAGESCAGALPRVPAPRSMTRAKARRLARRALVRTIGALLRGLRISCRASRPRGRACAVRGESDRSRLSGRVRVWHVREGAATRWRYSVDVTRRLRGCRSKPRCVRRVRRADRAGGAARPASLVRRIGT